MRCTVSNVDHALADEWAPVIDTNNRFSAVSEIRNLHLGSEGQGSMRCRHGSRLKHLSVGRAIAKETRSVPACFSR